jgi:hypothetical protein
MSKPNAVAGLPAPLSLTLEEAAKVAAGSSGLVLSAAETWWWKGQPAPAWLNQVNPVVNLPNAVGGFVAIP